MVEVPVQDEDQQLVEARIEGLAPWRTAAGDFALMIAVHGCFDCARCAVVAEIAAPWPWLILVAAGTAVANLQLTKGLRIEMRSRQ